MNDVPVPPPPKKRRVRKPRKDAATTNVVASPVEQADSSKGVADIVLLPAEPRKRVRQPRKRKPVVEAPADMISPDEPIVSGQIIPIPLAVPVGQPFPSTRPRAARASALTPQIVSLRASMLVPVQNEAPSAMPSRLQIADILAGGGRVLSRTAGVLRRHPRTTGLVMTAILLAISLTTAITLSEPPKSDATVEMAEQPQMAAAPAAPATPVDIVEESDPLAAVRIVDPSWDKKMSCDEGTWPYIDQRCLVKDETRNAGKIESKIGPRMIDSRTRPQAPEPIGPVGSVTAIVPAAPKVSATDGVAPRDTEYDAAGETQNQKVPEPPFVASRIVEMQSPAMPAQKASRRPNASPQRSKPVRTFRLSEDTKPVSAPRRVDSVKRKRQSHVAEVGRRTHRRVANNAATPQAPQFFFPFGWFVQAR